MATLDDLFTKYLCRIEPLEEAVQRAVSAHVPLREDLEKDSIYGPFVVRTLLSGSYGRSTAIFWIKDVDVIIQTSFTFDDLRARCREGETEQLCLLRLTQEAIRRTGRAARTRKARRSIHVTLPEEINQEGKLVPELTMDIVPVLVPFDKDWDPMTIADKDLEGWYDTYPNTQLKDSENRNKQSAIIVDRRGYKPLVKIFKAWKRVHFGEAKTPKGFVLECMTAQYHNPFATHWAEAVRDLWQKICDTWPNPDSLADIPTVPDISNSAPDLIAIAKTLDESKRVLNKIHQHLALVKQAIKEAETDLTQGAKTLRRVFGQDCEEICFPLPEDLDGGDGGKSSKSSPFIPKSQSDVREAPPFG